MTECGWTDRAERVADDLAGVALSVEPGLIPGDDAARLAEVFTRAERQCGFLRSVLAKRATDTSAWARDGYRSPEEWYARLTGIGLGAARDQLELAAQVDEQPEIGEAVQAGEISATQTKAISAAAKANPGATKRLLNKAKSSSVKGLKDECAKTVAETRSGEDETARHDRIHRSRYCRTWIDDDGAGRLDGRFTPEALAEIQACLDPFVRREFDLARAQGRHERHECYVADALLAMARAATRPANPPGDDPQRPGSGGPDGGPVGPPSTVIAVVSHAALVRGHVEGGETCVIDGVGPVPVTTIRAMTADAFLAAIVTDSCDIRAVAHAGRQVTARQRTALIVRDPHCVVPGCVVRAGLEIDHVAPWTATHITTLDQLARLCKHHHHQKTYGGYTLTGPPGQWTWTPPATGPPEPGPESTTLFDP